MSVSSRDSPPIPTFAPVAKMFGYIGRFSALEAATILCHFMLYYYIFNEVTYWRVLEQNPEPSQIDMDCQEQLEIKIEWMTLS